MTNEQARIGGALWMLGACACFAGLGAAVRWLDQHGIHPLESVLFRNLIGLVLLAPFVLRGRLGQLRTRRFGLHCWRAVNSLAAVSLMFLSMALIPIAEATALTFIAPLFATLGAALVLGEKVGPRRWGAVLAGFAGMLIVLRPGFADLGSGAFAALGSAAFIAATILIVRSLARTEPAWLIVFYMALLMTPLSVVPALFVWSWPQDAETWAGILVLGLLANGGQLMMARALALAEASAMMAVDFSRLIFASIFGVLLFAEVPDLATWIGGAVIIGAVVYTAHREARTNSSHMQQ